MNQLRFRSAVSPLRRESVRATSTFAPLSVDAAVARLRPDEPLHCLRPQVLRATARRFVEAFDAAAVGTAGGDVLYAVKCNPEPAVLRHLWEGGVRHFDCASPAEIRLVRQMFPTAQIHYMHPVKNRAAIREAYFTHGVRDFVLDAAEELTKILEETGFATDLGLIVRLAMPKGEAAMDLSGKFGAPLAIAPDLLRRARIVAPRVGVSFHVGSQMLNPEAYRSALRLAGDAISQSGVDIDVLDVGGGFPVAYPAVVPPHLDAYMDAIRAGVAELGLPATTRLWCEPGRALVAGGVSVVVQVERRRGDELFINDGVYGSLSDAGVPGFRYPCRLIRPDGEVRGIDMGFSFWGPTCDSADRMAGPFLLPADVKAGDWIEIGQLGAYGSTLRTAFNGFDRAGFIEVADAPLLRTPGHEAPHPVRQTARVVSLRGRRLPGRAA